MWLGLRHHIALYLDTEVSGDLLPPVTVEMKEHASQKWRYLATRLHVVATETIIM